MTTKITDEQIRHIARVCHEANKGYCETLKDFSQNSWAFTPENIQASAINGVCFKLNNPDITPEDLHDNWREFKLEEGWVYGPEKSIADKTHPCLIGYYQLPAEQRLKDGIFTAIVDAFREFYGEA